MKGKKHKFNAVIEKPENSGGAFVSIPLDVEKVFGSRGHIKIKAWFDGHPYRGIAANMGTGCHLVIVRKDIRSAIGKDVGDQVTVELQLDNEERVLGIPDRLARELANAPDEKIFFDSLSYSNRKEYCNWIASAKREETLEKRLTATLEKLRSGKKNPFEK